jgi:glycosyltransferase involved in cell wall biosynthesis
MIASDGHPRARVAHLICPAAMGGAETVVRLLGTGRARRSWATEVFTITGDGDRHPLITQLRAGGVPVEVQPLTGRRYLHEARGIARLVRARGVEVLHTHGYRADFIGYLAARMARVSVVSTFHGEIGGGPVNRVYEWSVKRLYRIFDAVICVAESGRERLRAAGSNLRNAFVVPNGAAFEAGLDRAAARAQLGINGSHPVVGWIGRLSHEKGPDLLLDAVGTMATPAHVVFIGDGPMRRELEQRAGADGLQVTFAGPIPDAARLLAAFDVVALSSRQEGMPMVLLESMGARVPVAAFLVGGIPALLSDETGWPAPPGDVAAFGNALESAIRGSEVARRRADAAEALTRERFGLESWVDAVEEVYDRARRL